ncbi:thiol-disulfide oxidoreductase DCC family protein [Cognatishimia activa]|uniref:thiol-disulfide oxidoreductase DCC family protein n=1 Tax=Cognatishimia activa TaxID=1715691 RepID=UPI00222FB5AC|nr:DUF393 domain-containing protein [Cognatishimia activa]UZD91204.1 DUF393 domain-containing protein [Cognatishimia activa]
MSGPAKTRALYNGDCPVCSAEMCHYEAYADTKNLPLGFEDLNKIDLSDWGVTEDQATRLLHVIHDDKLLVGWDAFLALWSQMPRYQLVARIGGWPIVRPIASWGYKHIVARIIYERHLRRKARGLVGSS